MLSSLNGDTYRFEWDDQTFRSKLRIIVSNGNTICGSHFYVCLDPDVEVSGEFAGQTAS